MTYRQAVDMVLLKNSERKVPFWYLAWNRELYYIDMRNSEVTIIVPTEFHKDKWEGISDVLPDVKIDNFLDLTRIILPLYPDTNTVMDANEQENVKELKKYLNVEDINFSRRY